MGFDQALHHLLSHLLRAAATRLHLCHHVLHHPRHHSGHHPRDGIGQKGDQQASSDHAEDRGQQD
ncbi:hypothetical protein ACFLYP_00870 [Chloroflexota bacterium]